MEISRADGALHTDTTRLRRLSVCIPLLSLLAGCTAERPGDADRQTVERSAGSEHGAGGLSAAPDGVRKFCTSCHAFAAPSILPRSGWPRVIDSMYSIYEGWVVPSTVEPPPKQAVMDYYLAAAPESLPALASSRKQARGPLELRPVPRKINGLPPYPGVSHVQLVHLLDEEQPEILFCEMRFSRIFLLQPAANRLLELGTAQHPSHAEVVDLDRDGVRDVLVASLGTVTPSDSRNGAVVWLRGLPDGTFRSTTLASGLGRVAAARPADFDGDGDLDVLVAVFGWRKVGGIIWLENDSPPAGPPRFVRHEIDPRPGTIDVPVIDLNGDGRPDFIALISQHFETVVAFVNLGQGFFEPHTLFTAEHPNWGFSSIDLVDLDRDGDRDILFANGDALDDLLLKNYHGVQWLENKGGLQFAYHRLTDLYGAHGARAGDLDGDGDVDIVVGAFLPFLRSTTPGVDDVESLVWLEQVTPGTFERRPLEAVTCFHPALDVGDLDGDGDDDVVVANMTMAKKDGDDLENWLTIWENRQRR